MATRPARAPRAPKLDAVGAAAVEQARAAALEVAGPDEVGEHLGAAAEGERVTVHRFASTHRGYRGWEWTVVLARVPRARVATVSEVVLLPGDGALLAPAWVPWSDRIAPGDLGETDVLPFRDEDPLLDEGFEAVPDGWDDAFSGEETTLLWEMGLGRRRVVNREGRVEAATRWYAGDAGPDNPVTRAADAPCSTCGYLVGLTGSLRQSFGVCANAWSPDDGRVVAMDHGCGAHSETGLAEDEVEEPDLPLVDDLRQELDTAPLPPEALGADLAAPGGVELSEPGVEPAVPEPVVEPAVPEPVVEPAVPEPVVEPAVPEPVVEPAVPEPVVPSPSAGPVDGPVVELVAVDAPAPAEAVLDVPAATVVLDAGAPAADGLVDPAEEPPTA